MPSQTRLDCENAIEQFSKMVGQPKNILYVGTAGNPDGKFEQPHLFPDAKITTFDVDPKWKPDVVGDITCPPASLHGLFDLVIMTQVIEHIPNLFDVPSGITKVLQKNGYAIIDCPFNYRWHPEPSFGDYWRLTPQGMEYLFKDFGKVVAKYCTDALTSYCFQKK